jgi:hypothetical protein
MQENFDGTSAATTLINDRTNTLAASTNPRKNPAAPIGISTKDASAMRTMYASSFPRAAEGFAVAPLINDENSYLGLVKFCQENGSGDRPFDNSKFAENCGVCTTEGTTILLDSNGNPTRFTTPTGVLVYKGDKVNAMSAMATNGYPFPNVVPSLETATCLGASASGDSKPVLAINQKDLVAFKKRVACQAGHAIGGECGLCVSPNVYSYVPSNGGINPITIFLWGAGTVTLTLGGQVIQPLGAPKPDASGKTPPATLSATTPLTFQLGAAREGTPLEIEVVKTSDIYLYGALRSTNTTGGEYILPLDKFIESDRASNTFPRYLSPMTFSDIGSRSLKKIVPSNTLSRMQLVSSIPVTLLQSDQLAAYDCPTSPIMMLQASAEVLIDDPCLNPRGQSAGNYTDECLKDAVTKAGCSVEGDWYKNTTTAATAAANAGSRSVGEFIKWMQAQKTKTTTDVIVAKGCLGTDISTPCDAYVTAAGASAVPSKQCMIYTYTNSSAGSRIGSSYTGSPEYTSLEASTPQFCQSDGNLNPETESGLARLQKAAAGYGGKKGLAAVRAFLSDVYAKATNATLDLNKTDGEGGRKDSWYDCIGLVIADPAVGVVRTLASGKVQSVPQTTCRPGLPISYKPQINRVLGTVPMTRGDYSLSFTIKPTGLVGNWSNIIRFRSAAVPMADCCTPGQRSPAIWFVPGTLNLHVRIGDLNDGNWGINTDPIPMGQMTTFNLICKGNSVTLTLHKWSYTIKQPSSRAKGVNMTVYGSDPWYPAAQADITNLCYTEL